MEEIKAFKSFDGQLYTVEQEARKADASWAEDYIHRTLHEMVRQWFSGENPDAPDNKNRTREDTVVDFVMSHYPLIVDVVSEVGEKIGRNVLLEPTPEPTEPEEAVTDIESTLLRDGPESMASIEKELGRPANYCRNGHMRNIHGRSKDDA